METTFAVVVGRVLVALREAKGVSQSVQSQKLGISQSVVSRIETGSLPLTLETLVSYARALETTPSAILQRTEQNMVTLRRAGVRTKNERPRPGMLRPKEVGALIALGRDR